MKVLNKNKNVVVPLSPTGYSIDLTTTRIICSECDKPWILHDDIIVKNCSCEDVEPIIDLSNVKANIEALIDNPKSVALRENVRAAINEL